MSAASPTAVQHPVIAESLAELLDRIRGQRNDYTHLWRCLRFVVRSPEIGAIADQEAAIELGRMLTVQLGELRVLECSVAEDLWELAPTIEPAPPHCSFAALHAAHPWALHEALQDRGVGQGRRPDSPLLDTPRLATLWLLDEATLREIGAAGRSLRRESEERRRVAEGRGGEPVITRLRPEDVLHTALLWLGVPDHADAEPALDAWARDAWGRVAVHLNAERRRWSPSTDPLPLARLLNRLGLHNTRFGRIGQVLVAVRQGIQNWLGTLPPGFPTLPPTQRQDREFLFGMQRTLIRDGARRVAALSRELFPSSPGEGPPTPIIAFTEDVRSRVSVDGDRIAIFCPLYFQDAPRYLVSILHECAHGFIPDVRSLYRYGAFAPWLEGPVTHAVHRVMTALGGPEQREEAYDCVSEILADCIGIALGGPGLIRSLLAVTIAETPFAEEVEIAALPDPFTRCRILLGALGKVWTEDDSAFRDQAIQSVSCFIDDYFREVRMVADGIGSPAHAPPGPDERAEAARLLRFDAAVRVALTDFAVTVLEGVATNTLLPPKTDPSPRRTPPQGVDHWVFRYQTAPPPPVPETAARLVDRLIADGDTRPDPAVDPESERAFLLSALNTPAAPSRCAAHDLDEGQFIDANTLHLLWADWFRASPLDRCRGPQRDLPRMVQLALCLVHVPSDTPNGVPRRRIESSAEPNYWGRGWPLGVTLLDNSARAAPLTDAPTAASDPVLGAPVGPRRWFHALGQFDYAILVAQPADRASYADPFDFGSHELPYYTRQQELRLLDPRRIHTLTDEERADLAYDPGQLVEDEPSATSPVFYFLHRVLFDRPGRESAMPPALLAGIVRSFRARNGVAVRGILRGFTWAEMGLWLECEGDLGSATEAIAAVSTRRVGALLPAQTHTLTLIRWTPVVRAIHERVAPVGSEPTQCIRALRKLIVDVGGSPPVRFLLTLYWPRGHRGQRGSTGGDRVDRALATLQDALGHASPGPTLEFADVLGDEDFQAWLDVPRLRLLAPPTELAAVPDDVCTQAITALLLLYTTRALGAELGVTEVTSQVALPRRPPMRPPAEA